MPNDFMGLSNLGLTQPSASSKVDDASGPSLLDQLLSGGGNQILDDTARARLLEQAIGQTQAQPDTGILQQLLSPQGLLSALGTGIAGAMGGGEAAAQFGMGSLSEIAAAAEAKNATKRKAIEELEKRLDTTYERLDKSRNRIAQMFNTNPEAFVNPVTGEQTIDPEVLGFYTTGLPVPTFATTRRIMGRRDEQWKETQGMLQKSLESAQSPEDAASIMNIMFRHLDFDAPPEVAQGLARAYGTKEWEPALINTLMHYGGASAIDAMVFAGENRLPLTDPQVVGMIKFQDPETRSYKYTPNDRFMALAQEINAWQKDPANRERIRELRQEVGKKGEGAVSMAIAAEVLGGRRGDFDLYKHEAGLRDPDDMAQTLFNLKMLQEKYGLGISISGIKGADPVSNMSDEEQNQYFWGMAEDLTEDQKRIAKENQTKQNVSLTNETAMRLRKEFKMGAADANEIAGTIAQRALQASTRPDGKVDRVRFEQEMRKLTEDAIKNVRGE